MSETSGRLARFLVFEEEPINLLNLTMLIPSLLL